MNKSDLVTHVAEITGFKKSDSEKAVDAVFEAMTHSLSIGEAVRLITFGIFSVKNKPASAGRNPRTGAPIVIAEKTVVRFQPGKNLKEAVDKKE